MRTFAWSKLGVICALAGFAVCLAGCEDFVTAQASASDRDKREIRLTIYSQDFAMVSETRLFRLASGQNDLLVNEVSRQMDPQSVLLRWAAEGEDAPQTVSQIYDLGMENTQSLLQRYAGKEVDLVRYGHDGKEGERRKGTLLLSADGQMAFRAEGQLLLNPEGTVVAPDDPSVSAAPALLLQVTSPRAQASNLYLAYLTRGLSWTSDYVVRIAPDSDKADIECWATVTNQSGIDFPAAKVELVAGASNRAVRPGTMALPEKVAFYDAAEASKSKSRELLAGTISTPEMTGEGYAYSIEEPATISHNRMNRVLMFGHKAVPIVKDYSAELPAIGFWMGVDEGWGTRTRRERTSVQMAFWFLNRKEDALGLPLPAGTIRVYEPGAENSHRYIGAASIPDTPGEEKVFATLSKSFDLAVEPRLIAATAADDKTLRKSLEVTLANRKQVPVVFRMVQPVSGLWKMVSESHPHTRASASRAEWKVEVPAGSETVLKYTVDLTHK